MDIGSQSIEFFRAFIFCLLNSLCLTDNSLVYKVDAMKLASKQLVKFKKSWSDSYYSVPQANLGNSVANAAANAAISNVASQGLNIITGQQKGFSWSSVAASAVGGAVGNYVGSKFNVIGASGAADLSKTITKGVVSGMAGNVASQLTQIAINGKGRLDWASVAVAGVYGVQAGFNERDRVNADIVQQQRAALGVNNEPLYSSAPKGAFTQALLNSQAVEAAQLSLINTPASAGGLNAYFPFSTEQVMPDNNAATTQAYFKQREKENAVEAQKAATNKVYKQFNNVNAVENVEFNLGGVDFLSNNGAGNGRVQGAYWSNISDEGVTQGSFAQYAFGKTMGNLEKVGYGIYDSVSAAISNPKDGFKGARNMVVNLGPDLYNLATNGTKTSLNGYSMLFEQTGLVDDGTFADFRNTKAYNINPLLANENQAQNGGSLLGGLALGKLVSSYGQYGVTFESVNATGPLKYQAGAVNIRLTAPAFATTAEATAAAEALGYTKVDGQFSKFKQPIYRNNKADSDLRFISPDIGSGISSHNGGVWKAADSIKNLGSMKTRSGTYDADLNWLKK